MRLSEILNVDRIWVDMDGSSVTSKGEALRVLSAMLAPALGCEAADVEAMLLERENLQSTGIGDGVAIPHCALDSGSTQAGALILCPRGIDFDAIDGEKVEIIFGVVGPKRATGEHLRTLARISRLLRDDNTRLALLASASPEAALELVRTRDVDR